MSVRWDGAHIRLEGECRVEEAETLAALLLADRSRIVDVGGCRSLHSAVVQVLVAHGAAVEGAPQDAFLRETLLPALESANRVHSIGQPLS